MAPRTASLHSAEVGTDRELDRSSDRQPERASERPSERRLERPSARNLTDDGRYSLDRNRVPKGWVMEFKRHTIMGANDTHNQVEVRKYHWQPVLHKEQPHILGHLCKDENQHIIVGGLGLYKRPKYLNEDAAVEHQDDTNGVLREQLQALRLQSQDQVGGRNTFIKKQTVAVPQPVDQ